MRQKRFLSWIMVFTLLVGMFSFPAYAEGNTATTTISGDGTADKTGTMTITLVIPKKTPTATDLTFTAPSDLVYSGSNKAATVAAASGVTGLGTITVKYYSDASRSTEVTETKNVGTYYVGATVAEGDQYAASTAVLYSDGWTFNITASTPDAPAEPTKASATKTSVMLNAVSGCEYSKDGTTWQDSTEFTGLLPGTEYTFYQRVKATANTNASSASAGASFSTEADTYAMTITLTIKEMVASAENVSVAYDGQPHGISVTLIGAAEGATVTYCETSDGEYSTTPITKTDAGTYTVYYKVTKTGYNAKTDSSTITITAKALTADDITVTAPTYTGSDLTDSITVKFGNTTLVKGTDYDVTYAPETVKDAGEYKATLTFKGNYSGTSVEETFTVSKPSSGGGSSSPTVTVPVSGDQHSVNVSASVSGTTATVNIKDADIEKITHADAETGVVEIDLSGLKQDVNTAKIPTKTVEKIAEAIAEHGNDTEGVSVKLSTATVTFDGTATQAISEQAKGNTIEIKVDEADKKNLTAEQKSSIEGLGSQIIVEATVVSNGQKISDFKGGSAEVSIPYTLKNAQKANGLVVFFVADNGTVEKVPATYVDGNVVFTVKHFSHYVVAYNAANVFTDVAEGDYYYDAVKWAVENGITKGTSATTFSPNGITTRAQVVTFLWRAAGCPEPKAMSSFSDVAAGNYYEKAVAWAVENGITSGVGGNRFAPNADCTRGQIVTFLYRYNGVNTLNIKDNPFTDVAEGEFYYDAVLWAAENGVTSGTSATTFSPASNCLRGQVVTFLYRLLGK